jgi:hypothetical protein
MMFISIIEYLEKILKVVLSNESKLVDIDIELAAQGVTIQELSMKIDRVLALLEGPQVTDFALDQDEKEN